MEPDNQKRTWFERLGDRLPTLDRDDRKALVERVEADAAGGIDFQVMMVLSSHLCASSGSD